MIFELYVQKCTQFSYLDKSFMSYQLYNFMVHDIVMLYNFKQYSGIEKPKKFSKCTFDTNDTFLLECS